MYNYVGSFGFESGGLTPGGQVIYRVKMSLSESSSGQYSNFFFDSYLYVLGALMPLGYSTTSSKDLVSPLKAES